jgi:hypothetical protein
MSTFLNFLLDKQPRFSLSSTGSLPKPAWGMANIQSQVQQYASLIVKEAGAVFFFCQVQQFIVSKIMKEATILSNSFSESVHYRAIPTCRQEFSIYDLLVNAFQPLQLC